MDSVILHYRNSYLLRKNINPSIATRLTTSLNNNLIYRRSIVQLIIIRWIINIHSTIIYIEYRSHDFSISQSINHQIIYHHSYYDCCHEECIISFNDIVIIIINGKLIMVTLTRYVACTYYYWINDNHSDDDDDNNMI